MDPVGGVFGDRDVGGVAQDLAEHTLAPLLTLGMVLINLRRVTAGAVVWGELARPVRRGG
jgi:ACR3 family arsenite efflux pump ArsB